LIVGAQGTWLRISTTLQPYQDKEGGTVTYGVDLKGKIIGIGYIKVGSSTWIENVVLIDGLKHNLLSISQLCYKGLFLMTLFVMF